MPGPAETRTGAAPAPGQGASGRGGAWTDLRLRVLSASLLAPLALACIWAGGLAWLVLLGLAAVLLAGEWAGLAGARSLGWPGALVPLLVLACGVLAAFRPAAGLAGLAAGAAVVAAISGRAFLAAGVPYVGAALLALLWLRADPAVGRGNVLCLVLLVWASDIGAYAAGRALGGPKLAPRISPGKTWSGAAGGLLAVAACGALFALATEGRVWHAALVGAILGLAAQAGDLFESWAKRRSGVKDSSRLIPGHGGLLDRLDGVLAAAPVAACLSLYLGRGVELWA